MAYEGMSSVDLAEKTELDLLITRLKRSVDNAFRKLDAENLQVIKTELSALESKIASIEAGQKVQNRRLDELEDVAPNTEITADDVTSYYGGA